MFSFAFAFSSFANWKKNSDLKLSSNALSFYKVFICIAVQSFIFKAKSSLESKEFLNFHKPLPLWDYFLQLNAGVTALVDFVYKDWQMPQIDTFLYCEKFQLKRRIFFLKQVLFLLIVEKKQIKTN